MAQVSCLESAVVHELDNGLTMREAVNPSTNTITVQMVYEGEAWLGFGVSPEGSMTDADAVIGLPDSQSVTQYDMTGEGLEFVSPWSTQTLSDASVTQDAGVTTLTFTMPLVNDGQHEILASGPNTFLYAYGGSNELSVHAKAKDFTIDAPLHVCGSSAGTPTVGETNAGDEEDEPTDEEEPTEDEDEPTDEPVEDEDEPTDEGEPAKNEEEPAEDEEEPAKDEEEPAVDEDEPAEDEDEPAVDEDEPAEDEDEPAEDEDEPAENEEDEIRPEIETDAFASGAFPQKLRITLASSLLVGAVHVLL